MAVHTLINSDGSTHSSIVMAVHKLINSDRNTNLIHSSPQLRNYANILYTMHAYSTCYANPFPHLERQWFASFASFMLLLPLYPHEPRQWLP